MFTPEKPETAVMTRVIKVNVRVMTRLLKAGNMVKVIKIFAR